MTTDHGLIDELLTRKAISSNDSEDIKSKPTEYERVTDLIDVILRRSDRTLKMFLESLVASNQIHVAQVVEKGLSSLEGCSLQSKNKTPERNLVLLEQSHVARSEEIVCDLASTSQNNSEKSLGAGLDLHIGRKVDLCKIEAKATNKTESRPKEVDDNVDKENSKVGLEKRGNHVYSNLPVDDKEGKDIDPAILELQLKLKLVGKERDRKISEVAWLRERLRKLEEEKDEISKDLTEILELSSGHRDSVIIRLNQRIRELENEKEQLSKALEEAIFAKHKAKEEYRDLQGRICYFKHGYNLPNACLLDIRKEMNDESNEGIAWSGIPDAISSFCFTNISVIFFGSIILASISVLFLGRKIFCINVGLHEVLMVCLFLCYLYSYGFDPGVGVGRYCEEDKCVYLLRWEYLSKNMRTGEETFEQISNHNCYDGSGGLFKSPATFAVWNKFTSHRWDEEMREYTRDGRFVRKIYTKPLLGANPFHLLTVFRLRTGLVDAGHGSLFYDDPLIKVCLLDTNGNIIKSFGGQFGSPKGVPMVLDADREGCFIVADQQSRKTMIL